MQKNGFYGYIAGMISAVALQPFDNIKMVLMMPPQNLKFTNNFLRNAQMSIKYLANDEGIRSFYRGMIPNVIKTGFATAVYFFSLRFCQKLNQNYQISNQKSFHTNFLLSSIGRIASAVSSNPFNVLQTRFQMAGSERWSGSVYNGLKRIYTTQGIQGFFKGGLANCYKQGIFAGLFYSMYEQGKKLGIGSTLSGVFSGVIATLITHPLQIVRAQLQTSAIYSSPHGQWYRMSIRQQIVQLAKSGQLLKGVSPRLIKKPLSNTISFLLFQAMQNISNQKH